MWRVSELWLLIAKRLRPKAKGHKTIRYKKSLGKTIIGFRP